MDSHPPPPSTGTGAETTALVSPDGYTASVHSRQVCDLQFLNLQAVKNRKALRAVAKTLTREFRAALVRVSEEFQAAEERIFAPRELERQKFGVDALQTLGVRLGDVVEVHTASGRIRRFRLHALSKVVLPGSNRPAGYRLVGLGVSADEAQREFESCIIEASRSESRVRVIARLLGTGTFGTRCPVERTPTFLSDMTDADRAAWLDAPYQPGTDDAKKEALAALSDNGLLWAELASTQPFGRVSERAGETSAIDQAIRTVYEEGSRVRAALALSRRRQILRMFLRVIPGQRLNIADGADAAEWFLFEGLDEIGHAVALRGRRCSHDGSWVSSVSWEFMDTLERAQEIVSRCTKASRVA